MSGAAERDVCIESLPWMMNQACYSSWRTAFHHRKRHAIRQLNTPITCHHLDAMIRFSCALYTLVRTKCQCLFKHWHSLCRSRWSAGGDTGSLARAHNDTILHIRCSIMWSCESAGISGFESSLRGIVATPSYDVRSSTHGRIPRVHPRYQPVASTYASLFNLWMSPRIVRDHHSARAHPSPMPNWLVWPIMSVDVPDGSGTPSKGTASYGEAVTRLSEQ